MSAISLTRTIIRRTIDIEQIHVEISTRFSMHIKRCQWIISMRTFDVMNIESVHVFLLTYGSISQGNLYEHETNVSIGTYTHTYEYVRFVFL
jgi:hypothetical protein